MWSVFWLTCPDKKVVYWTERLIMKNAECRESSEVPVEIKAADWQIVHNNGLAGVPNPDWFLLENRLNRIDFGKKEVEDAACLLVKFFCQEGEWRLFELEELSVFSKQEGEIGVGPALFGLICPWLDTDQAIGYWCQPAPYIVQVGAHSFAVTNRFIDQLKKWLK